jgi:hypothetical protein
MIPPRLETAEVAANHCRRCTQRLLRPTESAAHVQMRLLKVENHLLLMRCVCGSWCPVPLRLRKILLEILHASMLD